MSALAPDLFQRRFDDFMEIGRARLRSLAPEWTDHNAHDPGITLMELLAWVGEAQLYSLSRLRRDERLAYAAMLGVAPSGTRGALGLIWPDRLDPRSPATGSSHTVVIPEDAAIELVDAATPAFRPTQAVLWVPGEIRKLETRTADGRTVDYTTVNGRGAHPFQPFGERAGRRDVLAISFECRDRAGLLGDNPQAARAAAWPIGVLAAPPAGAAATGVPGSEAGPRSSLSATLVFEGRRVPLAITSDSTEGLLTTGTLLLDLGAVPASPAAFTIELRSRTGFPRPPRLLRIEPNVIPVRQGRTVRREEHEATGLPDWSFQLAAAGLRFASGSEPLTVEVADGTGVGTWRRVDALRDHGPDDAAYELDAASGRITFGNGVNGRIPPRGAVAFATYAVSDGDAGGVARNRRWQVAGFAGPFGVNPDPIVGGAAAPEWTDLRREARRRAREEHALVSASDIEEAARAMRLLEVARTWVVAPGMDAPHAGGVTLVAMRSRPGGVEPEAIPEGARWLEAIRRALAPRVPLGTRLSVVAPRYVGFSLEATVEAGEGLDPETVKKAVEARIDERLALVDPSKGRSLRQPGVALTHRDIAAWIRSTDGVRRIRELRLLRADGTSVTTLKVSPAGLPRRNTGRSRIDVVRPAAENPR